MKQEIIKIPIEDLHLWTENPRDPIDTNATDVDIIKRVLEQPNSKQKWNLEKLINEMGNHYDLSELPTVVKDNNKYIVYDGNRRMIILKYAQNPNWSNQIEGTLFSTFIPDDFKTLTTIPCNVCDKDTALDNIKRKHSTSGSWEELEREYFLHNHRRKDKSDFLIIEESTGIISSNPKMNKGFVNKETFTRYNLNKIGFDIQDEKLVSNYSDEQSHHILKAIVKLVENGIVSTREYRRKLLEPLKEYNHELNLKAFDNKATTHTVSKPQDEQSSIPPKITRRTKKTTPIFGGTLSLKGGDTNDIYRDIEALYDYYISNNGKLSKKFPSLIRMSLRLLVESTRSDNKDTNKYMDTYIQNNFDKARKELNSDQKTTLNTQSIKDSKSLISFLHIGAHDYSASSNLEQTLAMSLIIGKILTLTHGKKN